jgi:RNA polymerase sigma-70 factor (ECF subfamily)
VDQPDGKHAPHPIGSVWTVSEFSASVHTSSPYGGTNSTSTATERAAAGSRPDLQELLREIHVRRLAHGAARRVLADAADAADVDDAAQETLIAVSRGIHTFEGRSRFTSWLHRIAVNAALDVLHRRTRAGSPSDEVPESGTLRRMSPRGRRLIGIYLNLTPGLPE